MGKLAFVFPGQGSQYVGMAQEIVQSFSEAREVFKIADQSLGYKLSELCFYGPEEKLKLTIYTQPALLTASIACLSVLKKAGIQADYTAGHSLGEYSAMVAADVLDFADAVRLVEQRGQFMQEAVPPGEGTMAAILGLNEAKVQQLCAVAASEGIVEPANFNCPGQIVIAGSTKAVTKAVSLAKEFGARRGFLLSVTGPFHSSLLKPASLKLAQVLDQIVLKNPTVPVMANVNAEIIETAADAKQALIAQVDNSVKWEQSIRKLLDLKVTTFVEIGSGRVLSGLIKRIDKNVRVLNIEDPISLERTLGELKVGA